jgi:hypothetical protein
MRYSCSSNRDDGRGVDIRVGRHSQRTGESLSQLAYGLFRDPSRDVFHSLTVMSRAMIGSQLTILGEFMQYQLIQAVRAGQFDAARLK